ncbi:MAG: sulfotransferase [Actinomycetota bacterium]|nr:sulfotransferase [Actinomycetota bacterium]
MARSPERSPICVLCPPRSFSSVTVAMLGQHPELFGFPELELFAAERVADALASADALAGHDPSRGMPGLMRTIAYLHDGRDDPAARAAARAYVEERAAWATTDLYRAMLAEVAPRRGIEKSPVTLASDRSLERFCEAFPDAQFLHLTRHPATSLGSLQRQIRHWHEVGGAPWSEASEQASWTYAAFLWCRAHRRALAFAARRPEAVLQVRGEELVSAPRSMAARIADFLEIRSDADALAGVEHPESSWLADRPEATGSGMDRLFTAAPSLRCPPAPPAELVPAAARLSGSWRSKLQELAEQLGYSSELDA